MGDSPLEDMAYILSTLREQDKLSAHQVHFLTETGYTTGSRI